MASPPITIQSSAPNHAQPDPRRAASSRGQIEAASRPYSTTPASQQPPAAARRTAAPAAPGRPDGDGSGPAPAAIAATTATDSAATTDSSQLPRATCRSRPEGRRARLLAAAIPSPSQPAAAATPSTVATTRWSASSARTASTPLAAAKVSDSKLAGGADRSRRSRPGLPGAG
jgi:hypothetical protein